MFCIFAFNGNELASSFYEEIYFFTLFTLSKIRRFFPFI
jgi:hypothetical protein